jgi:hypothetical protein
MGWRLMCSSSEVDFGPDQGIRAITMWRGKRGMSQLANRVEFAGEEKWIEPKSSL